MADIIADKVVDECLAGIPFTSVETVLTLGADGRVYLFAEVRISGYGFCNYAVKNLDVWREHIATFQIRSAIELMIRDALALILNEIHRRSPALSMALGA
jgi:S-adenosylmethionine synthetase